MRSRVLSLSLAILAQFLVAACGSDTGSGIERTASFEDLPLGAEGFWNGSDGTGGFYSGSAHFNNGYNAEFQSWEGFGYSSKTDTTTPGFENQYSAIPGSGADGSAIYAVGLMGFGGAPATVTFSQVDLLSVRVTNTTYAYLSMKNGDAFAKRFGGADGTEPDWFKLTITGKGPEGEVTGTVEVYLADFRADDPNADVLVDDWLDVDLTPLGYGVDVLEFSLSSSDNGEYGMNTPGYFALDDLTIHIPEG